MIIQKLITLPDIDLTTLGDMTTTYTRGTTYFELSNQFLSDENQYYRNIFVLRRIKAHNF